MVEKLIAKGAQVDHQDSNGRSALHEVNLIAGEWIYRLFDCGMKIMKISNHFVYSGREKTVELLIGKKANVNIVDEKHWTPIAMAAYIGKIWTMAKSNCQNHWQGEELLKD